MVKDMLYTVIFCQPRPFARIHEVGGALFSEEQISIGVKKLYL